MAWLTLLGQASILHIQLNSIRLRLLNHLPSDALMSISAEALASPARLDLKERDVGNQASDCLSGRVWVGAVARGWWATAVSETLTVCHMNDSGFAS